MTPVQGAAARDGWFTMIAVVVFGIVRVGPAPIVSLSVIGLASVLVLVRRSDRRSRPIVIVIAALLALAVWAGTRSEPEPAAPPAGPVAATVTLRSDPTPGVFSASAIADLDGFRVQLRASGRPAEALLERLAGEQISVTGTIDEPSASNGPVSDWLRRQGVGATLRVEELRWWRSGSLAMRAANGLRRTLADGAAPLDADQRSLFAGFVLGDDRLQRDIVTDDFRAAGLGHLLAVSGSNVAFLLALLAPGLARLDFRLRVPAILAALVFFALVTRAEPSVLRATVMAGTAAVLAGLGRPASGRRLLAFAVVAVSLAAPPLVRELGFQLSVVAAAGIVWVSPSLAGLVPGPRIVANALAVTAGAQLCVAPLLIATFGGVPVASLPANLAAAPAAGPISAWGLTGGLVAGVVGGRAAAVLHWPTRLLLGWVQLVARLGAHWPLGELTAPTLIGLLVVIVSLVCGGPRKLLLGALVAVLLLPTIGGLVAPPQGTLANGVRLWRSDGAVVVALSDGARPDVALESVRRAQVTAVHVIIAVEGGPQVVNSARALAERYRPAVQWSLASTRWGATVTAPAEVCAGGLSIRVVADGRLVVAESPLCR